MCFIHCSIFPVEKNDLSHVFLYMFPHFSHRFPHFSHRKNVFSAILSISPPHLPRMPPIARGSAEHQGLNSMVGARP